QGLPTFFAKIWGGTSNTVSATATAEAYNSSGYSAPIAVAGVRPWMLPNCQPGPGGCAAALFNSDGSINNPSTVIGRSLALNQIDTTVPGGPASADQFYALDIPISSPTPSCPTPGEVSCDNVGSGQYFDNLACFNPFQFTCGQQVGTAEPVTIDPHLGTLQLTTAQATQCL